MHKTGVMKKMWDMIKEVARVLCIAVFFPGVEVNFDAINHYFGTRGTKKYISQVIAYWKVLIQQRDGNWQQG